MLDRIQLLDRLEVSGKICAEVGVLRGDYSAEIMQRQPSELHLIDPWESQDKGAYDDLNNHEQSKFDTIADGVMQRFGHHENVFIHRMYSHQFARAFRNFTLDFVYLDGNHSFQGVLADLFLFYPMLRDGGWIAGHDCGPESSFIGVDQALIAFGQMTGLKVDVVTDDAPWRSFAIKVAK